LNRRITIAVIGGSQCTVEEEALAEAVGRELARQGIILVCGGLDGVMQAACKGVREEGGITVGILPGDSPRMANPYVLIPVVTGMGHARNVAVVRSAQAVIAIDGSYGTLSEIGHALQSGIPVIGLNTWSLSKKGQVDHAIISVGTAVEAVDKAIDLIT